MKIFNFNLKIIVQILFVIIFLSTSPAKSLDKFNKSEHISDYFSGILLLNDNQYEKSFNFLKKLDGLEASHKNYSIKYLYSLVNSGNLKEAFNYSKKLEKQKLDSFESHLVTGIFYLKNSDIDLAQKYFLKAKSKNSRFILNNFVSNSLYSWSNLGNFDLRQAFLEFEKLDQRFENLKKIQTVFLNCYFNSSNTNSLFEELVSNEKTDFSRYNYFYASFAASSKKIDKAKNIVNSALKSYPRNLLLNQYKLDLNQGNFTSNFDCNNKGHVIAEILYITSNALSSQSIYSLSNFYLNLAKYLNEEFHSYDILLAENFYKIDNFEEAKKIYENIGKKGKAFNWHASKQLAKIYIQVENKDKALDLMSKAYNNLASKDIYEIFDYAEFLKNNEKFEESILYYSKVIDEVKKDHLLYAEAADGRGVAYERTGEWDKAERDLLASLEVDPEQAYVINYLAYTWIEQGVKIEKSLSMLEKANKLRSNDPYITDSLGWALFKLERYKESKDYLQLAVKLMPGDPIVNDHYGDVLWKNGKEIQARYYWNYVLNLKKTEDELKKTIEQKLIKGI
jgi:tetratricopeptide (TPR) repeat protein